MNYPEKPTIGPDHPVETTDVTLSKPHRGLNWDALVKVGTPILLFLIAIFLWWNVLTTQRAAEKAEIAAAKAEIAAKEAAATRAEMVKLLKK